MDLFPKITFLVCADGAANHLYDTFKKEEERYISFVLTRFQFVIGNFIYHKS
jgi:thiamine pyrophosphokinase